MASSLPRILVVYGTRPEAIKLAPVERLGRAASGWELSACNSGQHRELLEPVLAALELRPERALTVMRAGQGLNQLTARLLRALDEVIAERSPAWVVVQGDTTTAMAAALAAFHRHVPVAHVEAGLRTGDLAAPFPEEANRQLVARVASLHLAPTPGAAAALRREGIAARDIVVTGNTVVDAALWMRDRLPKDGRPPEASLTRFVSARRLVLVTGHRRESFDGGLEAVCRGVATLASAHPDVDFVYPVHLNPRVADATRTLLGRADNVHLIAPVGYAAAVWLIARAEFVITDSGGLQEEAPVFRKPVLVTRVATERP
ncbi:MAG: UDP-N-acetylglucosamine 2-epimerase (non-hydrolyzing), partial [Myxococcales bacterium]|nr:UDP-N-acetylglucosamine 2-epimerase (non-hydrolyzing) [Myxococcales bacterium]